MKPRNGSFGARSDIRVIKIHETGSGEQVGALTNSAAVMWLAIGRSTVSGKGW